MKMAKKILVLVLALAMTFAIAVPAFAQTLSTNVAGSPGSVVSVTFSYANIAGINGTFSFSNESIIASKSLSVTGLQGEFNPDNGRMLYSASSEVANCIVTLRLTLSANATAGQSTTVTFAYETSGADGQLPATPVYSYDTATVLVQVGAPSVDYSDLIKYIQIAKDKNRADYTEDSWNNLQAALTEANYALGSSDQAVVNRAATNLKNAIDALVRVSGVDYSELMKQIAIAESLKEADYTSDSWAKLVDALAVAKAALSNDSQEIVNKAAADLAAAIAALVKVTVKVDYTELNAQIAIAEGLTQSNYTSATWTALATALENARAARNSNNQGTVDAAAAALKDAISALILIDFDTLNAAIKALEAHASSEKLSGLWMQMHELLNEMASVRVSGNQQLINEHAEKISALLAEIIAEMEELKKVETVIKEVEVPVEPTEPFCNKGGHIAWIVLFWISFALNLAAGGLIGAFFYFKKKNSKDNTPLVDYDPADDNK